jgi:hypothetical protein
MAQLLRGRAEGIFVAPFEQGGIGPDLFEAGRRMGLEGLVSKHRERVYRGGERCAGFSAPGRGGASATSTSCSSFRSNVRRTSARSA